MEQRSTTERLQLLKKRKANEMFICIREPCILQAKGVLHYCIASFNVVVLLLK